METQINRSNKKNSKESFVHSMFVSLIVVMTFNHLMNTLVGMVDSYCISAFLKDVGLSAIGLTGPLLQIISGISAVFAVGGELIIAKLLAKGESKNANKHFMSNILFLFVLGFIFALTFFFIANPLAKGLSAGKASDEVIKTTSEYLKGFVIGIPFMFLNEYIFSITYLDNDKKRTTISIFILFFTNVLLDTLLGYYLKNKAFAIGIASSISYILSCLFLFTHFISKKSNFKLSLKGFSFKHIKESFVSGIPVGVKNIVITIRVYWINFLLLTIGAMGLSEGMTGDLALAAHGIESNITNFFESGLGGLISTVLMLGGVFYSEEDEKCLDELLKEVIKFTLLVGGILSIIYFFTAPYIAKAYSSDKIVIDNATYSMRANALAIIFLTFATSLLSFLQATKRRGLSNLSTFLQSLLFPIIFVCILGFALGIKGVWIGIPLGFVVYVVLHLTFSFIKNKKIKFNVRTLFFLPKDFGYKEDEMYETNITSIKDAYTIQKDVYEFCKRLNIDSQRKENLSNAAEELASIIVISGFSKAYKNKKRKPHASIRVLYKRSTDTLLIRTRDNCDKFDIKQKIKDLEEGNNKDLALNCSLKILIHISKDIEYSQLLKTNNMIIKC